MGKRKKSKEQSDHLFNIYKSFEEGEFSKIYSNNFFGYTKVVVEQPLKVDGNLVLNKKEKKPDTSKRDFERILLDQNINEYFIKEVKPHLNESWMDRSKDKIGYEINFTKYFYKFNTVRDPSEILNQIKALDSDIKKLEEDIF